MLYKNLTRHPDIGSNSYLLEFGGTRVVLDAGTHPKHAGLDTTPKFDELAHNSVDGIFVTHPHLDHIGALPCLQENQPDAVVIMSDGTKQAGRALLHNSVNVMTALRKELNEPAYPLYSHRAVDYMYKDWVTKPIGAPFYIGDPDRIECEFYHAGHVLGAVGIRFKYQGRSVFYSGDVHFEDQTLTRAAVFPEGDIDDLIIESTRGATHREAGYSRESEKQKLGKVIRETMEGGGAVLIPVFAFGKTQEVVLMLKELMEAGDIDFCPVHIGGLSSKMTAISDDHSDCAERLHSGYKILQEFPDLNVMPKGRSEPDYKPGEIYAISSGMMSENTVSNRFAKHILNTPQDTIIFVGYADPESPAGKIQNTPQGEVVCLDENKGWRMAVQCRIERFDFSGHATRDQIVDFACRVAPSRVILVHGDQPAKQWLKQAISERLTSAEVLVPQAGDSIKLS